MSYVSSVVVLGSPAFFSVSTGRSYQGGSSILHLEPQHSISLQPDSVMVWMKVVIDTLIAMMMDAIAVIIYIIIHIIITYFCFIVLFYLHNWNIEVC